MTIFYVYLKWARESDGLSTESGRHLLTCESRYVADEFFRELQTAKHTDGRKRFASLERETPQLWYYDSIDKEPWFTINDTLRGNTFLSDFGSKIISQILPVAKGGVGREWPIIPLVHGPDWVHNGAYFIRNKRRPEQYWHHMEGYIHVSNTQMTKFRVRGVDFAGSERKVLIRSDRVEISLLEDDIGAVYIEKEPGSNRLSVCGSGREWKFSELLGGFRGKWGLRGNMGHEFVTWTKGDDGDEWELC